MAHDIFISYSTEDKPIADAVCASLESRKIRCWIAPRDVRPGVPYGREIIDAIEGSKVFVLVFSSHSNKSPYVMREVERAVSKGIPIIPFRIEDVAPSKDIEFFISAPHWLDAWTPPLEAHAQKLADTIFRLMGQEPEPGPAMPTIEAATRRGLPTWALAAILVVAVGVLGGGGWLIFGEPKGTPQMVAPTATAVPASPTTAQTTVVAVVPSVALPTATPTAIPLTDAPLPPTDTPKPPTATPVPPTMTAAPPTNTTAPPTTAPTLAPVTLIAATPLPTQAPTSSVTLPLSSAAISLGNASQVALAASLDMPWAQQVAWSYDGAQLAVKTSSGVVIVDAKDPQKTTTLEIRGYIWDIAFSPTAHLLAVSGNEAVTLWDTDSMAQLQSLTSAKAAPAIAISPDGVLLAAATNKAVTLLDVATGKEMGILTGHRDNVIAVAFSPEKDILISASMDSIKTWKLSTGEELRSIELTGWRGALALSPDGKELATTVENNARILAGGQARVFSGHKGYARCLAFSPDGTMLATGSADLTIKLWNAAVGTELATLKGHTSDVTGLAFSPDGGTLASAANDGTVRLWAVSASAATPTPVSAPTVIPTRLPLSPSAITTANAAQVGALQRIEAPWADEICWASDGGQLAVKSQPAILLFDTVTWAKTQEWPIRSYIWDMAYVPASRVLAISTSDALKLLDSDSGAELLTVSDAKGAKSMAFSPDGSLLAAAVNKAVPLLDATTGTELGLLIGHSYDVNQVAFSGDGRLIVSAASNEIKVWDVLMRQELLTIDVGSGSIHGLAISPDGSAIAAAVSTAIRAWDISTGRQLGVWDQGDEVRCLAFSPDGSLVAGGVGLSVKLWDTASGEALTALKGHTDNVTGVAFSPDGATLASVAADGALRLWGLATP